MSVPKLVVDLVERFRRNESAYRSGQYNETQVRREFIDPFFECLGWDVNNRQGYAEAYKEVIHEDSLDVEGAKRAPDYCFRIGGTRKFFLEAKKPSVNVREDISPAYQLRRYAWTAKLPLSILTDFEEFAVYDGRVKPALADKSTTARVLFLPYVEYLDRWTEIASRFSKEAILQGAFDQFADTNKGKRGTATVDQAFLAEIESWRDVFARNIALRNPGLDQRGLNDAVQRTIDRIIFLRLCEDRGIEDYGRLYKCGDEKDIYDTLKTLFIQADYRYNSGLFHFEQEKGRAGADHVTLDLSIDDKILKPILRGLYYPDCPYEFSVMPPDILGQVYEQFLGKVIRLTPSHQAKVEEKPEVRKAGGVYYTPSYIVDYIVKHTVGTLLEGKAPRDVDGTKKGAPPLRVLDPACGSGSFLIVAYQYLLDWYRDRYAADDPEKHCKGKNPKLRCITGRDYALTVPERKRILLDHIYGVDIDPQAVEVTKLSLLLKVIEGESAASLGQNRLLFQERALPDLDKNIKCGNSLIGPDYFANQQTDAFDTEEMFRVNAFDWSAEFSEIMNDGGFDAIIGNPPYVDIKGMCTRDVEYIFQQFRFANNRINLFSAFIEKGFHLCKNQTSVFSMIVPSALLAQESYKNLRLWITASYDIESLVRLPNESFGVRAGNVKVDTIIFVFSSSKSMQKYTEIIGYAGYERISRITSDEAFITGKLDQERWKNSPDCVWTLDVTSEHERVLEKCENNSIALEKCVDFSLGVTPYDKYKGHSQEQIKKKVFHADYKKDNTFKKLLGGNDVHRYFSNWSGITWISYGPWLGACREKRFFTERRILVKQIIDWTDKRIWATITDEEVYNTQNAFSLLQASDYSLDYLLGILNSKLMTFYHRKRFLDEFKMRFQKILIKDCKRFPVRRIDFSDSLCMNHYSNMISLVKQMLSLHKQIQEAKTDHERTLIERQITATDRQIDQLVYALYGLTEEEIALVEKNGGK